MPRRRSSWTLPPVTPPDQAELATLTERLADMAEMGALARDPELTRTLVWDLRRTLDETDQVISRLMTASQLALDAKGRRLASARLIQAARLQNQAARVQQLLKIVEDAAESP